MDCAIFWATFSKTHLVTLPKTSKVNNARIFALPFDIFDIGMYTFFLPDNFVTLPRYRGLLFNKISRELE
jgi:hypothetical protein